MQENASDPLVGTLVDHRYLVRSRLAGGGMSTVYVAMDRRLERDVALKVLHPHLADDPQFLDRLGREAKAAARLSHPHVVGVLDQGEDGRVAYLVMEYIKGRTLRDVIDERGAVPPRLALALADPVVEGLGAAHSAGLIHRDIKPENVLIAEDGRIKLGDFGLARAITTSTSSGSLIGTVAYLAPELVLGKVADARSDIYSLGVMLYEMITGRQPFVGEVPVQIAYQHVNSSVGAPSEHVPGLAVEIDELVQWCTAKDPEQRPVDGNALLAELRHIRMNLTDAELDIQPPGALGGLAARSGAMLQRSGGQRPPLAPLPPPGHPPRGRNNGLPMAAGAALSPAHTEVLDAFQHRTEVITRGSNPTAVMAGVPRRPAYGPLSAPEEEADGGAQQHGSGGSVPPVPAAPTSKRLQRRLDREEEKARQRAAATPVRSLRTGSSRRRGLLWAAVLVLTALLAAGAGWFFGMGPGSPGTVPPVGNKTVAEAQQLLQAAGFSSSVKDVFDDTVPPGLVVGSEPESGQVIRKYQLVSLAVSKGPQLFPLPDLAGKSLEAAKTALNEAGMALGKITETYDGTAAGTVLAQTPSGGTPVRHGTPVSLAVSKGPQPVRVPDVRGKQQAEAVETLEDAGLKAMVSPAGVYDRKVRKGAVVAQIPAAGTLPRGGTVTLTVSKGPRTVHVPSFTGKPVDDARAALKELGFEVRVEYILRGFFGTVRDQDPANTEAPEGSTVTLTVF